MGAIIGEPPNLPIRTHGDDIDRTYESLRDLGIDLQFIDFDFQPDESALAFTDSCGARYRIMVLSLEIVLCVQVADDYDPSQLRLVTFEYEDSEMVVEALGMQAHRALSRKIGSEEEFAAVVVEDLAALSTSLKMNDLPAPTMPWWKFNGLWNSSVDPSLPIRLTDFIPRWLRRRRP